MGRARLPFCPSTTTGGAPAAAYRLLGVTRAVSVGVADEVATYGVCFAVGVDAGSRGVAAAAAAMTTAPTAPVMSFLRVWVVFMMCSLGVVAVRIGRTYR